MTNKIRTFIDEWWDSLWVPKYSFGEMVIQFAAALIVIKIITAVLI